MTTKDRQIVITKVSTESTRLACEVVVEWEVRTPDASAFGGYTRTQHRDRLANVLARVAGVGDE